MMSKLLVALMMLSIAYARGGKDAIFFIITHQLSRESGVLHFVFRHREAVCNIHARIHAQSVHTCFYFLNIAMHKMFKMLF